MSKKQKDLERFAALIDTAHPIICILFFIIFVTGCLFLMDYFLDGESTFERSGPSFLSPDVLCLSQQEYRAAFVIVLVLSIFFGFFATLQLSELLDELVHWLHVKSYFTKKKTNQPPHENI